MLGCPVITLLCNRVCFLQVFVAFCATLREKVFFFFLAKKVFVQHRYKSKFRVKELKQM